MSSKEVKLEQFLIPLEEIKFATNNFSQDNYLGGGGFGKVYKGLLSESRTIRTAAIKRLNLAGGQGKHEFMNELSLLSSCQHENIIPFIGYCDEGDEMIIAYEYATNKSLDQILRDTNKMRCITWEQRLYICIDSARGLNHLHCGLGPNHRIIHRDVKSANILLDDKWVAKISDFGLSKFSPKNQLITEVNTMVAGTPGYCDPYYHATNVLRKESDVYSFGVVLFEVLCGRLVFPKKQKKDDADDDSQTLVELTRRYKNRLDKIIDPHIRDQIKPESLDIFTDIAYQCLKSNYRRRPTMTTILETLDEALSFQENSDVGEWEKLLPHNYKEIIRRSDGAVVHMNKQSIYSLLSAGTFIDSGKMWFSLSKLNGKNSLVISAMEIFDEKEHEFLIGWESFPDTRFSKVANIQYRARVCRYEAEEVYLVTEMLSMNSVYAVLIICKYNNKNEETLVQSSEPHIPFKLQYDHQMRNIISVRWRDNEWMEIELFHIASSQPFVEVHFDLIWRTSHYGMYVEGIEFRPIESKKSDLVVDWEKLLPHNYEEIIRRSDEPVVHVNKQSIYSLLSAGTFIDGGKKWFSLSKLNGKNCLLISALDIFSENEDEFVIGLESFSDTRFPRVTNVQYRAQHCTSASEEVYLLTELLSMDSVYAVFIICKYNGNKDETHVQSSPLHIPFDLCYEQEVRKLYSVELRDNEWMEIELFHFAGYLPLVEIQFDLIWTSSHYGLYVEGIEFRPIESDTDGDETNVEELVELESDMDWEKKLPNDYQEIISRLTSKEGLNSMTKKEHYSLLVTGISIDDNTMWFWLGASNGKKCVMLSSALLTTKDPLVYENMIQDDKSRFSRSWQVGFVKSVEFGGKLKAEMLSQKTPYAAWLVFNGDLLQTIATVFLTLDNQEEKTRLVYLGSSSAMIKPRNHKVYDDDDANIRYYEPNRVKLDRRLREREDGWFEVELFPFFNDVDAHYEVEVRLQISTQEYKLITIQGIEFRPRRTKEIREIDTC